MQTLMVDFIISLDGYGAAEGWPGFWGLEGIDKDYDIEVTASSSGVTHVTFSRRGT